MPRERQYEIADANVKYHGCNVKVVYVYYRRMLTPNVNTNIDFLDVFRDTTRGYVGLDGFYDNGVGRVKGGERYSLYAYTLKKISSNNLLTKQPKTPQNSK